MRFPFQALFQGRRAINPCFSFCRPFSHQSPCVLVSRDVRFAWFPFEVLTITLTTTTQPPANIDIIRLAASRYRAATKPEITYRLRYTDIPHLGRTRLKWGWR